MADISSVLSEHTFTFLVGEQKQEFHIHPSVMRGISEPLYKLMTNGQMEESVTQTAYLPEVEPTVFAAFCRYSYQSLCDSVICLTIPSEPPDSDKLYDDLSAFFCRFCEIEREINMKNSYQANYCARCGEDRMPAVKYRPDLANLCESCTKTQSTAEQKHVVPTNEILDLGKLFVFADMYLVGDLKVVALEKLKRKLSTFPGVGQSVGAVVDLLRYTYEHTTDAEADGVGPLRKLVASHAIDHAKELSKSDEFIQLLSCGGSIVEEIVGPALRK